MTSEGVEIIATPFLTSALVGDEWSASGPFRFTTGEMAPGTHWIGGCVGPRASLDAVEKRKIFHRWESNQWLNIVLWEMLSLEYVEIQLLLSWNLRLHFSSMSCEAEITYRIEWGIVRIFLY
jgi:hypothetical protein